MVAVGDDILASHINLFLQRPLCYLVQAATQTMNNNATNAITFGSGSEVFDYTPAPFHDTSTNNTRIIPTVAGIYAVQGKVAFAGLATMDYLVVDAILRTNGSTTIGGSSGRDSRPFFSGTNSTVNTNVMVATGVAYIQFNGTTDYVELLGVQTNDGATASATVATGQFASSLSVEFVRQA